MSTNKPDQNEARSSSEPDDMIKPNSKDGKITLSEKELGDVTGGKKNIAQIKYEDITVVCSKSS
jgi:hypothetical protein